MVDKHDPRISPLSSFFHVLHTLYRPPSNPLYSALEQRIGRGTFRFFVDERSKSFFLQFYHFFSFFKFQRISFLKLLFFFFFIIINSRSLRIFLQRFLSHSYENKYRTTKWNGNKMEEKRVRAKESVENRVMKMRDNKSRRIPSLCVCRDGGTKPVDT